MHINFIMQRPIMRPLSPRPSHKLLQSPQYISQKHPRDIYPRIPHDGNMHVAAIVFESIVGDGGEWVLAEGVGDVEVRVCEGSVDFGGEDGVTEEVEEEG